MELVERLDNNQEVGALLRHISSSNLAHEDNTDAIVSLAERMDITPEEMFSYFWLQNYIDELTESFEDVPEVPVIAQQFGISFDQFQDYIGRRSGWRNRPHLAVLDCDPAPPLLLEGPSAEELDVEEDVLAREQDFDIYQANRRGMTLEEYREYMADLCEDAGLQG